MGKVRNAPDRTGKVYCTLYHETFFINGGKRSDPMVNLLAR